MNGPGAAPSASGIAIPGAILEHRTYSCGSGGSILIPACDGVFLFCICHPVPPDRAVLSPLPAVTAVQGTAGPGHACDTW